MLKTFKIFSDKLIRADFQAKRKEWLFSVADVCNILADSQSLDTSSYWRNLKRRLAAQGVQLVSNCYELKMLAINGKMYSTDTLNTKGLIELTKYIKSPHTDAFLEWLSQFDTSKQKYVLKHKDINVIEIELDENGAISTFGKILNEMHLPLGTMKAKGLDTKGLKDWWSSRSIPASRERLKEFLQEFGMIYPQQLLDKSFGLSLSDQYWICPKNDDLRWMDINFFHNSFSEDVGDFLFGIAKKRDDNVSLFSPDNTSDGQLKKKWKIIDGKRCLIKGGTLPNNQEVANEVLASRICERLGIPFVKYWITEVDGVKYSVCEDFITGDTELVAAWRIKSLLKKMNSVSAYDAFIQKVEELGVSDIRLKLDMMLTLDFIIANSDRHYNNFGLIRNANTLEWLGVAPIFDSGNSMWFEEFPNAMNANSIDLRSKPFNEKHSEQIKHVKDFSWLDLDKLAGIEDEFAEIYNSAVTDQYAIESRSKKLCLTLRRRIEVLRVIVEKKKQNQ